MKQNRRHFLSAGLALAGSGALPCLVPSVARAASNQLSLEPLAGDLSLVRGGASNIVVARSAEGLLLVDGGAEVDARALLKLLERAYPGVPVKVVLNTHWHSANTGFNALARKSGADVIAHENTKLWLSTVVNSRWEGRVYPAQPAAALPNRTFFYGPQSIDFGGRKIEYVHLGQAHTDGDIYVRFPEENVIVAGDVAAPGRYPIVDSSSNGWLGGIHSATKTLIGRSDAATKIVPGQGAVCGLDPLKAQEEMCFTVLSRIGENYYKGGTFEELVASNPTREFNEGLGDPALFLKQSYETAWYHVGEIRRVAR